MSVNTRIAKLIIAAGVLFILSTATNSFCAIWSPCRVLPPQITSGQEPNVLLVMDFSGSMQEPAYCSTGFGGNYASSNVG